MKKHRTIEIRTYTSGLISWIRYQRTILATASETSRAVVAIGCLTVAAAGRVAFVNVCGIKAKSINQLIN